MTQSAGRRPPLNKDTLLCISLAARPSNIGTRFHNHLYDVLGLDFVYKAFTTTDIAAAIGGVRALGIRGCSVSMPFKEDVLALVDEVEPSARAIHSVNTIVNDVSVPGGHLTASNTDYLAVQRLIATHRLDPEGTVLIRGSGGMANAVGAAFRDSGFTSGVIVARNVDTGGALADRLGYEYAPEVGDRTASVIVNVTPIGMAGGAEASECAFDPATIAAADTVFDVVALPSETSLIKAARDAGTAVVTGAEVIALQAAEQFERYTGVRPTDEQVAEASEISRA
ncbi:shikimate 5-dehydrogenase [Mycolicibacterium arabiense]|uniref:Shikimate 5-dehydrogenase n=1 Tax=Mycolicibacterium arabiense TaxID=1286181 RepID=A0A7I7S6Z1_9MYCO|nr:shikimate 5-dehydrogenase [Mycolicibacterium arabiense]MCV7373042.1 shikimate 5-dehydrogenase [Mycolicibacterium arabiense]BBY51775.1 shikimate 5-dehydrogenase [Mycolicibacterium arabiense]